LFQGGITRVTDDQRTENATDTGTRTSDSNGGGAGADILGGGVDVHSAGTGLEASHEVGRTDGQRRGQALVRGDWGGGGGSGNDNAFRGVQARPEAASQRANRRARALGSHHASGGSAGQHFVCS